MRIEYGVYLCFLFLVLNFPLKTYSQIQPQGYSYQQPPNIAYPFGAELINQETRKNNNMQLTTYFYRSRISQEEIVDFYRNIFSSQGWQESPYPKEENIFTFVKSPIETAGLVFSSFTEEENFYFISINKLHKMPTWPKEFFKRPRRLDFMPVYSKAREFLYTTKYSPMIGVAYLSPSSAESLREFYLQKMPGFGWHLVDSQSNKGKYDFLQWLKIVDPLTKVIPKLKEEGYDAIVPPATIQGMTLTFEQKDKSCLITIYNFPHMLSEAENTMWDAWAKDTVKHGKTLICVSYFYK